MFSVNDPIIGKSRGSLARAIEFSEESRPKRPSDVRDFLNELWRLSDLIGFDASLLTAQSALETDNWTSHFWEHELNAGGIGKFPDGSSQSMIYRNGIDAARAFSVHMAIYVLGGGSPVWLQLGQYRALDPRLQAVTDAGFAGTVKTLGDLGSGRWATDSRYAEKIVSKANQIFTEEPPMAITYGLVPHPPFKNVPIRKPENAGQNDLGQRTVKGVVYHRILGNLNGTTTHFSNPAVSALTDYGVGVLATDGAALAGTIYRWNDPLGRQSGWASGTYSQAHAYGDGAAFVNKYGVNAINRDQASIEISGFQNTPLDEQSRQAIAELTAYWADQYNIPWDVFPISPRDGFSFVRWHHEFGPDKGQKQCPFDVVKAETPALIERTRQVLRSYQESASPPIEPTQPPIEPIAEPFPGFTHGLRTGTDTYVDKQRYAYTDRVMTVRSGRNVPKYTKPGGEKVGTLAEKTKIRSAFIADIDGKEWLFDHDGFAYNRSGFTPKLVMPKPLK